MNIKAFAVFGVVAVVLVGAILFFGGAGDKPLVEVTVSPGEFLAGSSTSTPPLPPSNLAGTAISSTEIALAWVDNSSNESGFRLYRSLSRTDQSQAVLATTTVSNITAFQDAGLTASTTYYYAVRAFNEFGNSAFSNVAQVTTPSGLTIPNAPSNLTAEAISVSAVRLTWQDNSNNEVGFKLYRNTTRSTTGAVLATTTQANVLNYTDQNLNVGTTYYWAVRAFNAAGNSPFSNIASSTPTATGTLAVVDAGTPGYRIVTSGDSVDLLRLRYTALNEAIDLRQVVLKLSDTFINSPLDLVGQQVTLHRIDGVQLANATFVGDNATSTLINPGAFRVPASGSLELIVRGVINQIGAGAPLTASGDLLKVDYNGGPGNFGVGVSSGVTIPVAGNDTAVAGVRVMKSQPFVAKLGLPTNVLRAGNDIVLYRFQIRSATTAPLALYKWSFSVSPNEGTMGSGTTSRYALVAYTDSAFATPDTTVSATGLLNVGECYNGSADNSRPPTTDSNGRSAAGSLPGTVVVEIYPKPSCVGATTTYRIPQGQTRYFQLTSTIGPLTAATSSGIVVKLDSDASYPFGGLLAAPGLDFLSGDDDFIWSPMSTSSGAVMPATADFYNGFGVVGLPPQGLGQETLSR